MYETSHRTIDDVAFVPVGDFTRPGTLTEIGLLQSIPQYLMNLRGWLQDEAPNQAYCFLYYAEQAFKRAEILGVMHKEEFRNLKGMYKPLKTQALKFLTSREAQQQSRG